jgi:hypothetical protein
VVQLAQLRQDNINQAEANSADAAAERAKAAKARVQAARAVLESRAALLAAAQARGAEAGKLRSAFSRPPLLTADPLQGEAAQARSIHANELERALAAYRELLRYFHSIGATDGEVPPLYRPDRTDAEHRVYTWGNALSNWLEDVDDYFKTPGARRMVSRLLPYSWELTPAQMAALASPRGFRLVFGPDVEEEPVLFRVSADLQGDLESKHTLAWRDEFEQQGIALSEQIDFKRDGDEWLVTDTQPAPVVVTVGQPGNKDSFHWEVPGELLAYRVTQPDGSDMLEIHRRKLDERGTGRSPESDRVAERILTDVAATGRIVMLFLILTSKVDNNRVLTTDDYGVTVDHLGDVWRPGKQVRPQPRKVRPLLPDRVQLIGSTDDAATRYAQAVEVAKDGGDPDPLFIEGTPYSGTTVIRLIPAGQVRFDTVTVQIMSKYYGPPPQPSSLQFITAAGPIGGGDQAETGETNG